MKRLLIIGTAIAALFSGAAQAQSPTTILNASYDVAREVFAAENEAVTGLPCAMPAVR